MKNIRDSVHGNIIIDNAFEKTILDTPAFQRLRRVEQTAIRSIFPSARHDRFIHSLGVYYIGSLLVEHLIDEFDEECRIKNKDDFEGYDSDKIISITSSYLVACLLHDIAHAPFSHTFEYYYGRHKDLYDELNGLLGGRLDGELKKVESPNYHEYASAIVAFREYGEIVEKEIHADIELVCRMIIGCFYKKEMKSHELENCFISLLHGDVVDADRMDYACRDVWASGYCTSSLDVNRIVSATHIRREKKTGELNVCFDSNALNEISNMLDVRQFQNRYVINHHSVQYEQLLMIKAAEQAAKEQTKNDNAEQALHEFVNIERCIKQRFSDEDLLMIMKSSNNEYYQEFSSRQYTRFSVWKTPDEFFHYFPNVPRGLPLKHKSFEAKVKEALGGEYDVNKMMISDVKYKHSLNLKSLYIVVNDEMVRYTDIHPEMKVDLGDVETDISFYYLYVPKPKEVDKDLDKLRLEIVEKLKPVFLELYPMTVDEETIYNYIVRGVKKAFELLDSAHASERFTQIDNMKNDKKRLGEFIAESGILKFLDNYPKD